MKQYLKLKQCIIAGCLFPLKKGVVSLFMDRLVAGK